MFLSKNRVFLGCCLSFICGVAGHSFFIDLFDVSAFRWFFLACSLAAAAVIWRGKKRTAFLCLMSAFLFLGMFRHAAFFPSPGENPGELSFYHGRQIQAEGYICGPVKEGSDSQQFSFCPHNGKQGKALVTAPARPRYHYGEELRVKGTLEKPEPFSGFAYDKYLAARGIHSVFYYPRLERISLPASPLSVRERVYGGILSLRRDLSSAIEAGLQEPAASVAAAMILGEKKGIPGEVREDLSRAGLSHIVAVSGLHVGIIVTLVLYTALKAGADRNSAFYFVSLFLAFYVVLAGSPVSAVRAGSMGFLALLAVKTGRFSRPESIVIISAFAVLLVNPMLFRYDVGFQLSFLAVGAILFFYPPLREAIFGEKGRDGIYRYGRGVLEVLAVTCVIQLLIAPVVARHFGVVSLIAPVANLAVLWALPAIIFLLTGGLVLSSLVPAEEFLFFPAKIFVDYVVWAGKFMSELPFSFLEVKTIPVGWMTVYYAVVISVFLVLKRHRRTKKGGKP